MQITPIHWRETLPIRHQVLWPDKPEAFCMLDGDEQAWHFGAMIDGHLVGVASVYVDGNSARLRKFATLAEYQRQGIGSALLNHALSFACLQGMSHFWCDARESALAFYARFGLCPEGERFYKAEVPYFRMSRVLGACSE